MALDVVGPTIAGGIQGAVYGLLGLGLVLLYKSNKVFNFAQAEFGASAAFAALFADQGTGPLPNMPLPLAVVFGLLVGTAIALLTELMVIRPLFDAPRVTIVVATAGVTLLLIALQGFFAGAEPATLRPLVQGDFVNSGAVRITNQQLLIVIVLALLAVGSALFFSRTRTGTAIIAVSQEPTATSLVGISVRRVSLLVWGLAGMLGSIAGILLIGSTGFVSPGLLTVSALIPAFTGAVFGGITSLPGVFVGGVVVGVVEGLAQANIPKEDLPGSGQLALFLVLLVVLLVRPQGLLGKDT